MQGVEFREKSVSDGTDERVLFTIRSTEGIYVGIFSANISPLIQVNVKFNNKVKYL